MSHSLIAAIITINLALVFYTIGVWSEKIKKTLKPMHLIFFWIGLVFDTTGTTIMSRMAQNGSGGDPLHAITGLLAILLMLAHAIWATFVLFKKDEKQMRNFHKFSIVVWAVWLIPYLSGVIAGMNR